MKKLKVRVVVNGYNQKKGTDYQKIFSLMVKMVTLREVLGIAASKGWNIHQMDVFKFFFQSDLRNEIYIELP